MGVTLVFVTPMNNMMSNRTQAHLRTYRYANKIRIRSRQLQKFFTLPICDLETEEYYSSKFTQSAARMGLLLKKRWKLLACTMAFLMFMTMSPSLIPIRRRMGVKNLKDALGCWIEILNPDSFHETAGIKPGHGFLVTKLKNEVDTSDYWWGTIGNKSVDVRNDGVGNVWKWAKEVPAEEKERSKVLMKEAQEYDTKRKQKEKEAREKK